MPGRLRFDHQAGEPVAALDDTLFVSTDWAMVRFGRGGHGDRARPAGQLAAGGGSPACGQDVTFALGEVFAQTIPGTALRLRRHGTACVYDGERQPGGIHGLRLDLRRGTWAVSLRPQLELDGLANPVDVALAVGESEGSERILMTEQSRVWRYRR
ncbi:MAG: hypothetical protein IT201_08775 [Thermoleophilia bacterium]|nr:hypothetical protein [Thermoleophilia bacterium]